MMILYVLHIHLNFRHTICLHQLLYQVDASCLAQLTTGWVARFSYLAAQPQAVLRWQHEHSEMAMSAVFNGAVRRCTITN